MNITNISRQASQQHSQEYRILSLTTIFLMILIDDVCKATSFTTRPDSRSNPLPPSPVATSPTSSSLPFPSFLVLLLRRSVRLRPRPGKEISVVRSAGPSRAPPPGRPSLRCPTLASPWGGTGAGSGGGRRGRDMLDDNWKDAQCGRAEDIICMT